MDALDGKLDELAEKLRSLDMVHAAYLKPVTELALIKQKIVPNTLEPPAVTPYFTGKIVPGLIFQIMVRQLTPKVGEEWSLPVVMVTCKAG